MAEGAEKTEEATPRQLEKARERGEVSQSRELTSALLLATALMVLGAQAGELWDVMARIARTSFTIAASQDLSTGAAMNAAAHSLSSAAQALLPVIAALLAVAFVVPFLQVGPLLALDPLKPKLSKLNPVSGLKRQLFSKDTWIELLKALIKIVAVGWLCWGVIFGAMRTILMMASQPPEVIVRLTGRLLGEVARKTVLLFLGLAVMDVLYQRWKHRRGLRMSKEEIKREFKEQEGDPEHKAARRRAHEEIAGDQMLQQVRKADVIVTNPDHIACALRYDPDEENAPRLLGKGKGYLAEKIKEIAREEDIPIVRDISLAHSLYEMQIDDQIPEDLFDAVAEVLKWVELVAKSQGELPTWLKPKPPPEE